MESSMRGTAKRPTRIFLYTAIINTVCLGLGSILLFTLTSTSFAIWNSDTGGGSYMTGSVKDQNGFTIGEYPDSFNQGATAAQFVNAALSLVISFVMSVFLVKAIRNGPVKVCYLLA
jgi:hypothetical protein